MPCIECKKWIGDSEAMTKLGYARCEFEPPGHYRHGLAENDCKKKITALEVDIEKRRMFFDKINKIEKI